MKPIMTIGNDGRSGGVVEWNPNGEVRVVELPEGSQLMVFGDFSNLVMPPEGAEITFTPAPKAEN